MIALLFHIRCLLLIFVLIQSVSLYKIYAFDDNHLDASSSSVSDEQNIPIENKNIGYENSDSNSIDKDQNDNFEELKSKRTILSNQFQPIPQRRNNRPHWNPLVAAYKRCGELVSRDEREACFKDAVQMLFVHKLRK